MEPPDWLVDVIDTIEHQLRGDLRLDVLANRAGYSVRHLQRQFKQLTKENIGDYIRGRRLSAAMLEVVNGQKPIIDIAFDYGFQSQESFTRAFQSRFVFPPRRFRLQHIANPITLRTKIDAEYLAFINSGMLSLEPNLKQLGSSTFVGVAAGVGQNSFQTPSWANAITGAFDKLQGLSFPSQPADSSSYLISYRDNCSKEKMKYICWRPKNSTTI